MKNKRLMLIIALIPILYCFVMLPMLPDQVAIHWNINGVADNFGSKYFYLGFSLLPMLIVIISILLSKSAKQVNNQKQLNVLLLVITVFFTIISVFFIKQSTNNELQMIKVLTALFSLLFIILGNMMNKLHINRNFGIRLPATLKSEKVWNRIHYLGGYCFVLLGLLTLLTTIIISSANIALLVMITLLVMIIIYLTVYSEILYKRETGHYSLSKTHK